MAHNFRTRTRTRTATWTWTWHVHDVGETETATLRERRGERGGRQRRKSVEPAAYLAQANERAEQKTKQGQKEVATGFGYMLKNSFITESFAN